MIGALWTGISGLAGQQTALDNESHNIANVNTIGYKASRISFADQLYQDKIGKGTKVLDAEKLFVQGNLKLTGVAYDMAISGDGFFSVKNERASGTAETFFTRAGNFRMGDDGTLQDAAGNKVQGWGMSTIDPSEDVLSTNPNINVFTTDYTKLVASKVVSHSSYVETITAKTTDYATSAGADTSLIYDGAGMKSKSAKIADVEELVSNYSTWLQKYQDEPEGTSASSTAQISQIKFEGTDLKKEGDQIYVYINGNKYTQSFVSVVASTDADGDGNLPSSSTAEQTEDNLAASKIATYKALANQLSEIPGIVAHTVTDEGGSGSSDGTFEASDSFTEVTGDASGATLNALSGMIQIKSLIPGESFTVTEVAEVSGTVTVQGQINTTASATTAVKGSGLGALQSSRDALSMAVTGNQRDVFTTTDLDLGNATSGTLGGEAYTAAFTIYDKDTKQNVDIGPITLDGMDTVDEIIAGLKAGGAPTPNTTQAQLFNNYFKAENLNGHLVIGTNDANYDVEFNTTLTATNKAFSGTTGTNSSSENTLTFDHASFQPTPDGSTKSYSFYYNDNSGNTGTVTVPGNPANLTALATAISLSTGITASVDSNGDLVITNDTASAALDFQLKEFATSEIIEKNADHSGRKGAGAEFIELVNKIDQVASQGSLQLRLDTLGISDSAFGEFSVSNSGLITMKQDGAEFAIGQVSIALFNNTRGLNPYGDNLMAKTTSSGEPIYNTNNERTANIEGSTLELSTADLSESLVNLMVFQRAFEANAKSITTSDQLLNTLINLKR